MTTAVLNNLNNTFKNTVESPANRNTFAKSNDFQKLLDKTSGKQETTSFYSKTDNNKMNKTSDTDSSVVHNQQETDKKQPENDSNISEKNETENKTTENNVDKNNAADNQPQDINKEENSTNSTDKAENSLDGEYITDWELLSNITDVKTDTTEESSDETETAGDNTEMKTDITKEIVQNIIPPENSLQNTKIPENDTTENQETLEITFDKSSLNTTAESLTKNITAQESQTVNNITTKTENDETEGKTLEELVDEETLNELNIESVETETSSSGDDSSDLMQNQSPQEQGVKAMLQADADFTVEMKTEIKPTNVQTAKPSAAETNPSKILEQISKQLEGLNNGSKVNIVLNPESLGKVSLQLINTKEGLSAQFTVATQDAKNLLMKGLDGLKDTLVSHGVSVDTVTVKMNDTQKSEYNPDWTEQEGSRGGNKEQEQRKEHHDEKQFEQMISFAQNDET